MKITVRKPENPEKKQLTVGDMKVGWVYQVAYSCDLEENKMAPKGRGQICLRTQGCSCVILQTTGGVEFCGTVGKVADHGGIGTRIMPVEKVLGKISEIVVEPIDELEDK